MSDGSKSDGNENFSGGLGEEELQRLEKMAEWLDSRFGIPGTNIRFGLDALLGLVPGIGDLVLSLPSLYMVSRALHVGAPIGLVLVMIFNVAVDTIIGAVPLVGDLFDIGFKANTRNAELLRRHMERRG